MTCTSLALWLAGCHSTTPAARPEKIDMAVWRQPHGETVMIDRPTVVTEGRLPVVYQAMQGATLRVVDAVTVATVGRARLMPGEIIRADERGVFVGPDRVGDGPLTPDHGYRIVLEAEPNNSLGK